MPFAPDAAAASGQVGAAYAHEAGAKILLGNALMEADRPGDAAAAYLRALELRPGFVPALYNLANALLAGGDASGAEATYREALAIAPDHAGCLNNLGNALRTLGRPAEAAEVYRAVLSARPELHGAHNNLGSALLALHQPEAALGSLETALRLRPDYAEACDNIGGALLALDRPEAALAWFERAMALDPEQAHAQLGRAMALLSLGRLREGFAAYEARWSDPRLRDGPREYIAPLWLGEGPIAGRTLLLHAEQGFGDTIQFARYAPLLRARGARVMLEVQRPLLRLLAPLADAIVAAGDELPPHDLRTPLLSLPLACGTEFGSIPAAVPYLRAPPEPARARGPGLNVGLTIAGHRDHPEDALRSIPARLLGPLLNVSGVTLHLVQPEPRPADLVWFEAWPGARLAQHAFDDFLDSAALIGCFDVLVSVDTAMAHLAGALGRPVWILLQHAADFRWLRERADSPWYPTARLFRQGPERRWEPVIADVARALRDAAAEGTGDARRYRPAV